MAFAVKNGAGVLVLGCLITGYFAFLFDVTVPVSNGTERVVNLGLMNDRQIGTIVGIGVALAGIILLVLGRNYPEPPNPFPIPPPDTPTGFSFNILFAVHYKVQPTAGQPSLSRPMWNREVESITNLGSYRPQQIEWAYASGVEPQDFARFVAFIETYREWQFGGGYST